MGKRKPFRDGRHFPGGPADAAPRAAETPACPGLDLDLVLRTVRWLSAAPPRQESAAEAAARGALSEAAMPLVRARAAKYEEDAQAAKKAANAAGGHLPNNKRRQVSGAVGAGAAGGVVAPPADTEVGGAALAMMTLAAKPEVLASPACKPLRAALHPLVEAHLEEEKASPAFRVTSMLALRGRWGEALKLLADMRRSDVSRQPKLGAYQRWIRELSVSSGDARELLMLDAIMRLAAGMPSAAAHAAAEGTLERHEPWRPVIDAGALGSAAAPAPRQQGGASDEGARPQEGAEAKGPPEQPSSTAGRLTNLIASRRAEAAQPRGLAGQGPAPGSWSVVAHEAALERAPPNRFDLDIYSVQSRALAFDDPPPRAATCHEVPGVEGALVLTDVLSAGECRRLLEVSEAVGYRPDVPLSSALDERAQNVVLLASEEQNRALFERVRPSLPAQAAGAPLLGLNRRWRLYRYEEGNKYRKHVDGAWPASGARTLPSGAEEYVYDVHGGGARSHFTFIVYLNDEFEGGATTFFVPKGAKEGTLESRPVRPRTGSATVFPHGDCPQPLLHEGSPVEKGVKYLLRTDVVYGTASSAGAAKEAARVRGLVRKLGGEAKLPGARPQEGDAPAGASSKRKQLSRKAKLGGEAKARRAARGEAGKKDPGGPGAGPETPAAGSVKTATRKRAGEAPDAAEKRRSKDKKRAGEAPDAAGKKAPRRAKPRYAGRGTST